jgi:glycosyltransferase involved in cell wall biosynthesis
MENLKGKYVTFISTYPPLECGVGVFAYDLIDALEEFEISNNLERNKIQVVVLDDKEGNFTYNERVVFKIDKENLEDYYKAADFINESQSEVICLQHEYGMFGGKDGNYLLYLLNDLRKPVVTTLHTIQEKPTSERKDILRKVCGFSKKVITISKRGEKLLSEVYKVSPTKIGVIPHGAPDVSFSDTSFYKKYLNAENRPVIFTFGLIRFSKGLEVAIEAMAEVVKKIPKALYIILGATHPSVKKKRGESYRAVLERLVSEKNLEENVVFRNEFVSKIELVRYLKGSDICITPYLSGDQISSGVLSYALACGKAIISTPYLYAEELLAKNRGVLIPFKDSHALAKALIELIEDDEKRQKMRKAAYAFGRNMTWKKVATSYECLFNNIFLEVGTKL